MNTIVFRFAGVWKFKYTNVHGQSDCMITLDRNRAEEWAGRRDGILVQLYEPETQTCIAQPLDATTESLAKDGCEECVSVSSVPREKQEQ